MSQTLRFKCMVYDGEKDDLCGQDVKIDAWPEERQTHWYPGSAAGFEVTDAPCGHAAEIEDAYQWDVMNLLEQADLDAKAAADDARIAMAEERKWDR